MHEAGLLAAAIADALAAGEAGETAAGAGGGNAAVGAAGPAGLPRRPAAIEIRVLDPVHVGVESAQLHAELALRARGLEDVPVSVTADPVACPMCDVANVVVSSHPFCDACGWPLPDRGGDQVEAVVRWAAS